MSKPQLDSDGFQLVTSKKSAKNKSLVPQGDLNYAPDIKIDIKKSYRHIQTAVGEFEGSEYLDNIIKAVSNVIKDKSIKEFICFGLGHIAESHISRYQLALLLCLKEIFKPEKVLVHDPVFYSDECALLKKFNCTLIEQNTEATYVIPTHGFSLVYLPHCPKQLTNNFLWSNWGPNLSNCILLGNSFSCMTNVLDRILIKNVPFIHKIFPLTHEVYLANNFVHKDIFNNISLHYFCNEQLKSVTAEFWDTKEKPEYSDDVEFITSMMVEKLKL